MNLLSIFAGIMAYLDKGRPGLRFEISTPKSFFENYMEIYYKTK